MTQDGSNQKVYVTVSGLALLIKLEWPYHPSTSGADFWTLHSEIRPVGKDLRALVAVNASATVRDVLPSLEPKDAESPTLNALRKQIDAYQVEFLKSAKLIPLAFSSRSYDFKRNKWAFHPATDEQISEFLLRKVYWQAKVGGGAVLIADPVDAQYLGTTPEKLLELAQNMAARGVMKVEGNSASALDGLLQHASAFEAAQESALDALNQKHAFERG
jgi:hypothetical protein